MFPFILIVLDEIRRHNLKKGNSAKNPLIRGLPFWTVTAGEEEEMAEDDYPVDIEAIEKVGTNAISLKR